MMMKAAWFEMSKSLTGDASPPPGSNERLASPEGERTPLGTHVFGGVVLPA